MGINLETRWKLLENLLPQCAYEFPEFVSVEMFNFMDLNQKRPTYLKCHQGEKLSTLYKSKIFFFLQE